MLGEPVEHDGGGRRPLFRGPGPTLRANRRREVVGVDDFKVQLSASAGEEAQATVRSPSLDGLVQRGPSIAGDIAWRSDREGSASTVGEGGSHEAEGNECWVGLPTARP